MSDLIPFPASALTVTFIVGSANVSVLSEEIAFFLFATQVRVPVPVKVVSPFVLITALPSEAELSVSVFIVPSTILNIVVLSFFKRIGMVVSEVKSKPPKDILNFLSDSK